MDEHVSVIEAAGEEREIMGVFEPDVDIVIKRSNIPSGCPSLRSLQLKVARSFSLGIDPHTVCRRF